MTQRIIDYFMDKFIWSITESDPYLNIIINKNAKSDLIDLSKMNKQDIFNLDLKQDTNMVEMIVNVHRPYVILKDRSYFQRSLEVDLGEIIITTKELTEAGRFKRCPQKPALITKFNIDCKDLGITYRS